MSDQQLKDFLAAVQADVDLQEKLKAADDANAIVAIAMTAGFMISAQEINFKEIQEGLSQEISDEDLAGVVGGGMPPIPPIKPITPPPVPIFIQ